jgi:glycosyltransferase involved in cell wall biosynthesis
MDMAEKETLAVIVPLLNEEETIGLFYAALEALKPELPVNLAYWFVDDGSTDGTLAVLQDLHAQDEAVHFVSFSRNFGKEAALYAGLTQAQGEYVAVMDVDLQDPPELLPEMLAGVCSGEFDAVGTRRVNRQGEAAIRSWFADRFYQLINKISDVPFVPGARDFRVMSRQMVTAILSLSETQRFSKGIFTWVGFKTKYIGFENRARVAGQTSWSFWQLTKYAIAGIVSFSTVPLMLVSLFGFVAFGLSVLGAILIVIRELLYPATSAFGWPSLVVIILFMSGVQLVSLGVIGRYIAAAYLEVKKRPLYIVKDKA